MLEGDKEWRQTHVQGALILLLVKLIEKDHEIAKGIKSSDQFGGGLNRNALITEADFRRRCFQSGSQRTRRVFLADDLGEQHAHEAQYFIVIAGEVVHCHRLLEKTFPIQSIGANVYHVVGIYLKVMEDSRQTTLPLDFSHEQATSRRGGVDRHFRRGCRKHVATVRILHAPVNRRKTTTTIST